MGKGGMREDITQNIRDLYHQKTFVHLCMAHIWGEGTE